MEKKVLIITYYWPPSGGPGVQRVLHFVRHLSKYGWQPIVLTVENGEYPALDPDLESLVPNHVAVIKTKTIEPFNWYKRLTGKKKNHKIDTYILSNKKASVRDNIMRWIRMNVFIPDARIGWYFYAVRAARKIIKANDIDLIYSCSPPHTIQVIARKVAQKTGLPWVADFRDPWSSIVFYQENDRSKLTKSIDQRMEQGVLVNANKIITTCQGFKDALTTDFGLEQEKITVITNGYNQDAVPKNNKSDDLVITYAGNLSEVRMPETLLKCLGDLLQNDPKLPVQIHIAGNLCTLFEEEIDRLGLRSLLVKHGYITHEQVIDLYSQSDLLLLVVDRVPDNHLFIAGKLFDYIGAKKPILAFGPPNGEVKEIINETDSGYYFSYENIDGTTNALRKELKRKAQNVPTDFTFSGRERYSREALTGKLASIFDQTLKS